MITCTKKIHDNSGYETPSLLALPKLVLVKIFTTLSFQEIGAIARSCKRCYGVSKENSLWKIIYHTINPHANSKLTQEHLEHFNASYLDLIKNQIVFAKNVKKGIYSHQEFQQDCPAAGNYLCKQVGNAVEIFDMRLGKSYRLTEGTVLYATSNRVVTLNGPGCYQVWDIETGKFLAENKLSSDQSKHILFTDANHLLSSTLTEGIYLWNLKTGENTNLGLSLDKNSIKYVYNNWNHNKPNGGIPDRFIGNYFCLRNQEDKITFFNLLKKEKREFPIDNNCTYDIAGNCVMAFAPINSENRGEVKIWNLETGESLPLLNLGFFVRHYVYGNLLFVIAESKTTIFNMQIRRPISVLNNFMAEYFVKGELLVIAEKDSTNVLNMETQKPLHTFHIGTRAGTFQLIGKYLIVIDSKSASVKIWDIETGKHCCSTPKSESKILRHQVINITGDYLFIKRSENKSKIFHVFNLYLDAIHIFNINTGEFIKKINLGRAVDNISLSGNGLLLKYQEIKDGCKITKVLDFSASSAFTKVGVIHHVGANSLWLRGSGGDVQINDQGNESWKNIDWQKGFPLTRVDNDHWMITIRPKSSDCEVRIFRNDKDCQKEESTRISPGQSEVFIDKVNF